ncbi:hypothetical protein [Actinoplanes subglobosus]|uniref:Uncharacterized protein n=1 Tax=Actinoplanes subglobosus TaxID=1547892 RepID=A0ABV8J394_9ACTN
MTFCGSGFPGAGDAPPGGGPGFGGVFLASPDRGAAAFPEEEPVVTVLRDPGPGVTVLCVPLAGSG